MTQETQMEQDETPQRLSMAGHQFSVQKSTTSDRECRGILQANYRRPGPPGYEWCDWEGVNNADKVAAVLDAQFAIGNPSPRFPIYLTGGVGLGKTGLASVLYRIARRPIWRRADTFLLDLSTGRGDETYRTELRKAADASLLVLDDLAVRKPSEGMFHLLFDILELRKSVPTVITSNKTLDELCEIYTDGRIYSRFAAGTVMQMTGKDRRIGGDGSVDIYQI